VLKPLYLRVVEIVLVPLPLQKEPVPHVAVVLSVPKTEKPKDVLPVGVYQRPGVVLAKSGTESPPTVFIAGFVDAETVSE
jgi:hypothetical protein